MGRTIIWVGIRKYYGFELYKTYTLLGNNMILIRQAAPVMVLEEEK
jgi:hypothetical protein